MISTNSSQLNKNSIVNLTNAGYGMKSLLAHAKRHYTPVDKKNKDNQIDNTTDEKVIYLDYQATTPVDESVVKAMLPYFSVKFGNAHSRTHKYGWEAEKAVDVARKQIADLINATPREIIFTSGATESNNLAIKGAAGYYGKNKNKKHIITSQTEHKCVLASAQYLEKELGWDVTYLKPQSDGLIDLNELENAIRDDTALISIMLVNNEIGVIQNVKEIAKIAHKKGVIMHTDAAQAVGKIPVDVKELDVDLMSISAHKMFGPKGIGALYVRSKPRIRIEPQMHGGGQERGLRSGTIAVPLCVGFGEAARIIKDEIKKNMEHVQKLEKLFRERIMSNLTEVTLNGSETQRYLGICNISFDCVEGESLIMGIKNIAVSSGSACTSASLEPSYVLRSIGVDEGLAHTSIRFGFSKYTTEEEVIKAADLVIQKVNELRELSPLWEGKMSGKTNKITWT